MKLIMRSSKRTYLRDGRAPIPASEITSRTMSAIRAKNTKPEIILRKALFKNGLVDFRLHCADIPGRPDICYFKKKVAIFVHGCFWHRCPYCKSSSPKSHIVFWKNKFESNRRRDKRKLKELEQAGWKAVVIWECQIKEELGRYVKIIKSLLFTNQGN